MYLVIAFSIFYMTSCVNSAYTAYDAMNLQSALASNYSSKVRPLESTSVDVSFGMMHITELNIVNQQLHIVGFLMVMWTDSRLTWTPSDYGNMDITYIQLSDIWSPPLVLNNAADKIQMINDDTDLSSVNVYLHQTGFVMWLAPANFMAQCTINIKYYPFDSQTCSFVVSSWLFIESHLNVVGSASSINMDLYEENGEWDLTKSTVENVTRTLHGHPLPAVKFTTYLTRKYSYYLMNMLLPVIVLAIMAPFVFMLPVESGEKIGYALTILLSLSVVMTLVSESIPPTSTHICVLSVYLLLTYIICSVETLLTVVTCRIQDFHMKEYTMGPKLQNMTRLLAIITRSINILKNNNTTEVTQNNISPEISELKLKEKDHLEKEIMKTKAWVKEEHGEKEQSEATDYSFGDFVLVFDKFNFFLFEIITVIVTVVIMVVLRVGGAS
ncbi:neuronal acetylcholine receptor subunit alpha-9-like [Mercenaria mercenaria]|uniref:neuronal acetylcholine receptor subunit alpha-9-like n=1 Tax=Mercenaria mercenaria TaxID=6596 RepID=UPI00234F89B3|nr:neuronal acetylcholine receptor subunit alpha-9-like [Mercenaria mercenaria]XP_053383556.1 neuronal acetylcholine receptor subunit alpha-9-like [Mercenaria mercenaria]